MKIKDPAVQRYAVIERIIADLDEEDSQDSILTKKAVQTALALTAVYGQKIDELENFIPKLMPHFAAEALLRYTEPYRDDMKYAYIPGHQEFYLNKIRLADTIDRCSYQLAAFLLELDKQETLTISWNYFLEIEEHQKRKFLLPKNSENSRTLAHWKNAVWRRDAEVISFDWWNPSQKFRKILDGFWLGYKMPETVRKNAHQSRAFQWISQGTGKTSNIADIWLWIAAELLCLSQDGRAAVTVPIELLKEERHLKEREFLISQGCIESVVLLPERLERLTRPDWQDWETLPMNLQSRNESSSYAMLVLRAPSDIQKVYFADARNIRINKETKNYPVLSQEDAKAIFNTVHAEEHALSAEQLREDNWNLYQRTQLLMDIADGITRGTTDSLKELERLRTNEETDCQFLRLQDLQDGIVQEPLPFLSRIEQKYKKYCVFNETALLICRNGTFDASAFEADDSGYAVFKTAVLQKNDIRSKSILVSGNIYIIHIDENKANPYYIQAYLESREGQKRLSEICLENSSRTDTAVRTLTLGVSDLKLLSIPVCDKEKQDLIGKKFRDKLEEIKKCRKHLNDLLNDKNQMFSKYK